MTPSTLTSLLFLALIATLAPLLTDMLGRFLVLPIVVVEIVLGIALGPDVLGLVHPDAVVSLLASLGLSMLMFFAGFEIDFARLRGPSGSLALRTWAVSLVAGFAIGLAMSLVGFPDSWLILGLALTTTSLGTLVPILKDSGEGSSAFGLHVMANGAVGEFGPVLAISILFSSRAKGVTALLVLAFAAVAITAAVLAMRWRPQRLSRVVTATMRTSGQLAVRFTLLVIVALVWVAADFGLDVLLGAFTAGMVMRLFLSSGTPQEAKLIADKLEAVGFGFLIPIFFIVSGVRFELSGLLSSTTALLLLPVFLVLLTVVRGAPVLIFYRSALRGMDRRSLALFASTALPLVVAITTIGVQEHRLQDNLAAALVGAAMLSVAVFPLLALRLRKGGAPVVVETPSVT